VLGALQQSLMHGRILGNRFGEASCDEAQRAETIVGFLGRGQPAPSPPARFGGLRGALKAPPAWSAAGQPWPPNVLKMASPDTSVVLIIFILEASFIKNKISAALSLECATVVCKLHL